MRQKEKLETLKRLIVLELFKVVVKMQVASVLVNIVQNKEEQYDLHFLNV